MVRLSSPLKKGFINKNIVKMTETIAKEDSKVYEIGFHIAPIVGDEKVAYEVSLIKSALENIKAEVIGEDFPRLRVLAYSLSKAIGGSKKTFKEAYFGWIKFEAGASEVASLNKEIEKLENILRFLIIKTVKENTLYGNKFQTRPEGRTKKEDGVKEEVSKEPLNPEEMDKTIDKLVIE